MARVLLILGGLLTAGGLALWLLGLGPIRFAGVFSSVGLVCLQSGVACIVVSPLVYARKRFLEAFALRRPDAYAAKSRNDRSSTSDVSNGDLSEDPTRCHSCGYDCSNLVRGIVACPECGVVLATIPRGVRQVPDAEQVAQKNASGESTAE